MGEPQAMAKLLPWIILSLLAMVAITAGVVGLMAPQMLPQVAQPLLAWTVLGVGVILDVIAGVMIIRAKRSS